LNDILESATDVRFEEMSCPGLSYHEHGVKRWMSIQVGASSMTNTFNLVQLTHTHLRS